MRRWLTVHLSLSPHGGDREQSRHDSFCPFVNNDPTKQLICSHCLIRPPTVKRFGHPGPTASESHLEVSGNTRLYLQVLLLRGRHQALEHRLTSSERPVSHIDFSSSSTQRQNFSVLQIVNATFFFCWTTWCNFTRSFNFFDLQFYWVFCEGEELNMIA